jgi:hypothetical protein
VGRPPGPDLGLTVAAVVSPPVTHHDDVPAAPGLPRRA